MAYTADSIPSDHGEFSGGPGLIDPELRKDRVLTPEQRLLEMYATNPAPPGAARGAGTLTPGTLEYETSLKERAAAIALENDPATTPVPRVVIAYED